MYKKINNLVKYLVSSIITNICPPKMHHNKLEKEQQFSLILKRINGNEYNIFDVLFCIHYHLKWINKRINKY